MAVYYTVEFPLEDSKSQEPHSVPDNKVKVQNGKPLVLWSVVDQNGDITEQYFEATNLKKGSKKEIGDFIVLGKWQQNVTAGKCNDISRQNPPKVLKPYVRPGDVSRVSKNAVVREEAADFQSRNISKILPLTMKIIRHSLNDGDDPVEFSGVILAILFNASPTDRGKLAAILTYTCCSHSRRNVNIFPY